MFPRVHAGLEIAMGGNENLRNWMKRVRALGEKVRRFPGMAWKAGRDDPRRVIHAFKVGLSLTLVSLLYLLEPLFEVFGQNAIWAVMTVVLVLEFTAGATLCKGLNRGLGTVIAGSIAFLIEYVANESGRVFRGVFIGTAVFLVGGAATYMRFIPYIRKNYDYGVVIFLLTFNLITVSSYRVENVLKIAEERLYTIAIGCGICLLMSLLVFPNWSAQHLHNSTAFKLEGLAHSIQACVNEYFSGETESSSAIFKGYKAVLDSKSSDETLALHASWEARHSRHCQRFPSEQYLKLGNVLRQFGYTVAALHGCLTTQIQTPRSVRVLFKDPCLRLAAEVSKALTELGSSIRNRRQCSPEILSDHLHHALHDLNTAIKSQGTTTAAPKLCRKTSLPSMKTDTAALPEWKRNAFSGELQQRRQLSRTAVTSLEFCEALPLAAFAALMVETVAKLDLVIGEVEELGRLCCFKEYKGGYEDPPFVTKGLHVLVNE